MASDAVPLCRAARLEGTYTPDAILPHIIAFSQTFNPIAVRHAPERLSALAIRIVKVPHVCIRYLDDRPKSFSMSNFSCRRVPLSHFATLFSDIQLPRSTLLHSILSSFVHASQHPVRFAGQSVPIGSVHHCDGKGGEGFQR